MEIDVNNVVHEWNELVIDINERSYKITNKNENIFPLMFWKFQDIFKSL